MDERKPMLVRRIHDEFLIQYGNQQITDLVHKYYEIFDSCEEIYGGMQMNVSEIKLIMEYFKDKKFDSFCEVGVCDGGSLWMYSNLLCHKDSKIVAIDRVEKKCAVKVTEALKEQFRNINYVISDSSVVCNQIKDGEFDLIHIDGEHHYSAVKKDFYSYLPKLKKDGTIILHDSNSDEGVRNFISKDLIKDFNCLEFKGIGYIASSSDKGIDKIITGTTLVTRKE